MSCSELYYKAAEFAISSALGVKRAALTSTYTKSKERRVAACFR